MHRRTMFSVIGAAVLSAVLWPLRPAGAIAKPTPQPMPSDACFTAEQYREMHRRQIAIEHEIDDLEKAGVPEGDPRHKALYDRWLNLEHLSNV